MSLLKNLNFSKMSEASVKYGISNGDEPGHFGIWAVWGKSNPTEVFRVIVSAHSSKGSLVVPIASYTLAPTPTESFLQSIETSQELKQFLVGSDRATSGQVSFEFLLANNVTETFTYSLEQAVKFLRGKGPKAPKSASVISGYLVRDRQEISEIPHGQLKAYTETVKAQIAEKLKKAEEEKLRAEEEKRAALAKVQAEAAAKAAKPVATKAEGTGVVDRSKPTLLASKLAIVFGSSTGNTANVAELLKKELGASVEHLKNITDLHPVDFTVVENIILGVPTWHIGEIQEDWAAVLTELRALNFTGKKVAVFGLGDAKGYPDTYVDAMAELLEPFEKNGAKLCGLWPTDGYDFKKSKALRDGKFLGLVIDIENQDNLTDKRVKAWALQLQKEMGI